MGRLPAIWIVAAAATSRAAPPPAPPAPTWADWVGDWTGKLKWASCSIDGEERASLPLEAVDGTIAFDLTPAGAALSAMPLVDDSGGWIGQRGDVTIHLKRPKPDSVELAVDLDSGCQVRATLARESVGIAACDQLGAWARIESHCTKLSRPPLENAARLVRQRAEWLKARGVARGKLAAQCSARSTKVEQELVEAGCAPNPDPAIGMRGAECQALRGLSARLQRCSSLPSDERDNYAREVLVLLAAAQGADRSSWPVVDGECRRARDRLFAIAKLAGCPP